MASAGGAELTVHLAPELGFGCKIVGGVDAPAADHGDSGIYISEVLPGGAADKAGLRVGDRITRAGAVDLTEVHAAATAAHFVPHTLSHTHMRTPLSRASQVAHEAAFKAIAHVPTEAQVVDQKSTGPPACSTNPGVYGATANTGGAPQPECRRTCPHAPHLRVSASSSALPARLAGPCALTAAPDVPTAWAMQRRLGRPPLQLPSPSPQWWHLPAFASRTASQAPR
jgi:hypothetical protein